MTPSQLRELKGYFRLLLQRSDLPPDASVRKDIEIFVAQLAWQGPGRPSIETTWQRHLRRHEKRMPWIRRVAEVRRELKRERIHKLEAALEIVASEAGSPRAGTLRNWFYEGRGNSAYLPFLKDGTPNAGWEEP
jgi:hypothetical protein